ncbi:PREDICTED: high affinity cationic amino acid transporter 1-like [Diuraphis noxia]|uniref:high affinity cationic amino acid transporter 1-like n=1 Tax=Diuraphis noxia TaxID=143948 RepID=UPI0007636958|nr:PREDICTED: high affinity cationic amino acid transporter 1-like [Diuraphis noxia]XP_015372139.1 PREDICTED: high affinity cationic amino acid transporter 1-like [Diuraphis noxia]XP_015372140.1 PREDICTED: high affinity cationic amino acid transporter 1-like [Diuraphis noxia]XP_015372141.1 PREDICTED: high affinity cationic amino acid transporter 1-like [Diuraphis noxia]
MRNLSTHTLYQTLCRKKTFNDEVEPGKEKLKRVLNIFDLTALGIGSTLGCGVYVLAGTVAKSIAGPAVVLSFIVAAIVSSFSGVCYAEFAGRVPKAGSAYIYSYVTVGEFIAFFIGWTLFIEHTIGTASVAKAMTNYLDALLGDPQKIYFKKHLPMHVDFLGEYPDFASFFFVIFIGLIVAWGVKKSSTLNKMFTLLNLLTLGTVVASGFFLGKLSNWFIPKSEIPLGMDGGNGGFSPFGWNGIIAGAARCFYGFIGFDSIATTGEETKDPKRTIPLAIILSLFFVTLAYSSVASVLTLMWPYYDQDPDAPLPVIYENMGMPIIKYMVTCGAVFALMTTLLGCLFPIPRILYAMSSDGLLFKCLSTVNEKTKTPVLATVFCGIGTGLLSCMFNLEQLVEMTSIGTLMSYLMVCVCILILRYKNNNTVNQNLDNSEVHIIYKWWSASNTGLTSMGSQYVSRVLIITYTFAAFVFCVCMTNVDYYEGPLQLLLTIVIGISVSIMLISLLMLCKLPQAIENLSFKVPLVPLIPCLSILLNLYLMMELNTKTWMRFGIGIVVGLLIYAFYGVHNSLEGSKRRTIKDKEYKQEIKISN